MGVSASSKKENKKKENNTFIIVTIVINNEAIVAIDLCEDSTLADARNEILLESNNFPNLGIEYYFSHNDAPFSPRKEHLHTVRELAGSESRLELIPKKMEKETTKKETTKKEDEQRYKDCI